MRKICIVTSNRAEYWLLKPLMQYFLSSNKVQLQVLASGAHLSQTFGRTVDLIKKEGFPVDAEVECLPSTDDHLGMIDSISKGVSGFARAFQQLEPDIIVILGDRFEIFAAAQAAYCLKLPLAHLHGGELTQAALDEGFRHANSKFSQLHFVSHPQYKRRLVRMGEQPNHIWVTGAIGIDYMNGFQPISKSALSERIGFSLDQYILFTFHPSTLDDMTTETAAHIILQALHHFPQYQLLITQTNPDPTGQLLNKLWQAYAEAEPERICLVHALGDDYHSAVYHAQCVLGNSSSGILEVPYLGKRTINIGQRQTGRIFPKSVIQTACVVDDIRQAIQQALAIPNVEIEYIYGCPGKVAATIGRVLEEKPLENLVNKEFYDGEY